MKNVTNGGSIFEHGRVIIIPLQTIKGCTVRCNIKETKIGSSNQEVFPMEVKKTEIVLVPFPTWKCISVAISCGMDVSNVLGCLVTTDEFLVRVAKINWRIGVWTQGSGYIIKITEIRPLWMWQLSKTKLYQYLSSSFKFWWMWIFPWGKLSWWSCCM